MNVAGRRRSGGGKDNRTRINMIGILIVNKMKSVMSSKCRKGMKQVVVGMQKEWVPLHE